MLTSFKAAVCQMSVVEDKAANLRSARSMIKEAAAGGANLVVLPEMFNCPYDISLFPKYAESYPQGDTFMMLSEAAREEKIYLIGGTVPERDGSAVYNSSFVFNPLGELLDRHRKLHLFDIDLPDVKIKESESITQGMKITVVNTEFGGIGVAICFDLRFPELFRLMALEGASIVVVPAAFNTTTGPAHWEMLLRSRAVDNQLYIVAASPGRNKSSVYEVYGYSMVVDPWGDIVTRADEKEQLIIGEISMTRFNEIRCKMPLLAQRRTDLYNIHKKTIARK